MSDPRHRGPSELPMQDAHNNFFKLMVHGETLDVDALLARSLFSFDHIWRRGGFRKTDTEIIPRTSGVEKHLGDGRVIDVLEQETQACEFFEAHRDALRALADFPGAAIRLLGLHHPVHLRPGTTGLGVQPSTRLMKAMLETGFEPVHYLWFDRS